MRLPSLAVLGLSVGLAMSAAVSVDTTDATTCGRKCMKGIITEILDSMVAHNPYTLPLAPIYRATENSHPAALGMMTSWRTIVKAGEPSLIAIDVKNGTAYFALDVSEGNPKNETILRGRIAVVNKQITEMELFINRYRGDHGFSFSAAELPSNYAPIQSPPANRTKASREELMYMSVGLFVEQATTLNVSDTCRFTEIGWTVIDRGNYGNGTTDPVGCGWYASHPYDNLARAGLVVDEDLGITVQSGMIPGRVFAYADVSAFIPNTFVEAQAIQLEYFNTTLAAGTVPLLQDFGATGETLEVLQYYNGALQAMQINVYMSGPGATSAWLS